MKRQPISRGRREEIKKEAAAHAEMSKIGPRAEESNSVAGADSDCDDRPDALYEDCREDAMAEEEDDEDSPS